MRIIKNPVRSLQEDKEEVHKGLLDNGVNMSKEADWFELLYASLQDHISQCCKGDKKVDANMPTLAYFEIGMAVITNKDQLPPDVWDETGGFIVALQDMWHSRNWIFPHNKGVKAIAGDGETMEL